jgi:proteasome lid subunit RPN8/RPN11
MLRLLKTTVAELTAHASSEPDREVCGLVWAYEGGQTVYRLPNVHPEPAKYYRTEPLDIRRAFDAMDKQGGEPLAWYHSHPNGKQDPSETDMLGAFDTAMHYLILYPTTTKPSRDTLVTEWQLSAWECLEPQVLVRAEVVES